MKYKPKDRRKPNSDLIKRDQSGTTSYRKKDALKP